MYLLRTFQRLTARVLPLLLLLTLFQTVASLQPVIAAGPAPTVAIDIIDGVTDYTGGGVADSATGVNQEVTFRVTLTGLTPGTMPTGMVRIYGTILENIYCSTRTFSMVADTATGTCKWKVQYAGRDVFKAQYLQDPTNGGDYASADSASTIETYIAGIFSVGGLSGEITPGDTITITAVTYYDFRGEISFYVDGSPISNCQNLVIASNSDNVSCNYRILPGLQSPVFTFDYRPTNATQVALPQQIATYPVRATVKTAYYPNETSWEGNTSAGWSNYDSATLINKFYQHEGIFYKLNAANGEAMAVSYNRSIITTDLIIPETFTATGSTPGGAFNRTYSVTQIGREAFNIATGAPSVLLRTITIPNTVTVIKGGAFAGQCRVRSLVIPDSVRIIGADALVNMKNESGIPGCAAADSATGLETLTVGSGLLNFGNNSLKGSSNVKAIIFKSSPDALNLFTTDPANFDSFQYSSSYGVRLSNVGRLINACKLIINYSGAITGYLLGSQASNWRFWATADNCMLNSNLTIINQQFAPTPPAQPIAETPTVTSMRVRWQAPALDGDSVITSYSLQYSSDYGTTWSQSNCTSCQISDSPYLVSGLATDTPYIFRVIATNAIGSSAPSTPSLPVRTLAYSIPPAFSITPASETLTVGSATTYSLTSTYPAASYSISPAAGNGLTFDTTTGVLSGSVASIESAVAYAVTGTNIVGSHTETYTVTVIAAPVAPSAPVQISIPDPVQTSRVTLVSLRCIKPENIIEIKGSFDAKVINIAINGKFVPVGQWSQSADLISIKWAANLNSNIEIQLFNGQVPLLAVQKLTFVDQCAVEDAQAVVPTPTPSKSPAPSPSPTPTAVVNTQPTAEMKKISMLYFALGSYSVTNSNKEQVAKIAAEIMSSSVKTVLIYGHTDAQGGVNNTILSKKRAQAIVKQIRPLLKGRTIKIGWYAATKPAVRGKTLAAYAKNRRVEIWVK